MSTEINPRLHIRIEGDSWGCGVWDFVDLEYQNVHPGLQFFLEEAGFKVTNCSKPGIPLDEYFTSPIVDENIIIVFLTDPLRSIDTSIFSSYSELVTANRIIQHQFFHKIGVDTSIETGFPIIVLGGCGKVDLGIMKKYKKFICEMPSILEFLYNDYKHPRVWFSDWIEGIDDRFSLEDLDLLLTDKKAQDSIQNGPYTEFTIPDGRHPNFEGYKKLADWIIPRLKHYESSLPRLL